MPARIATVKKVETPVEENKAEAEELTLDQRVAYLEERNRVLEEKVLTPEAADEADPEGSFIVHRKPSYVDVNGVMTLTHETVRIPLSQNEAYETANGLR